MAQTTRQMLRSEMLDVDELLDEHGAHVRYMVSVHNTPWEISRAQEESLANTLVAILEAARTEMLRIKGEIKSDVTRAVMFSAVASTAAAVLIAKHE